MKQKKRLSYEDSCRRLKDYLDGQIPPIPDHLPQPDDEKLGVSFFRTGVGAGEDLANLTLKRTFFGRSEVSEVSFRNTDLSESNLCWNDFSEVDFTNAVLAGADLRASEFSGVTFAGADLRRADMRLSAFDDCDFKGALMEGAVLTNRRLAEPQTSTRFTRPVERLSQTAG